MNEIYEVSFFDAGADPWSPTYERYETEEAAVKRAIDLGFSGTGSTVTNIETGDIIHEVILQ